VLEDPRSVALGNEPVLGPDGSVVGRVSSGGLGYTLGVSIAYAWLPASLAEPGTGLSVEVFGIVVAAEVRADPLYDAAGTRLRN
jgi:4-methylaminobutanoate oxidase (formaldehyde-forming)